MIYLFMLGILGIAIGLIMLVIKAIKKQPKKLPLQVIGVSLALCIVGFALYEPEEEEPQEVAEVVQEEEPEELEVRERVTPKKEEVVIEIDEDEEEEEDVTWDDLKENIIGNSNKDYKELTDREPREVRHDNTGKWKITTLAESVDILEYANSYRKLYMRDGDVHFIVNFNYKTTTKLYYSSSLLYVDIMEYKDKEEHDASKLGSGMLLKQYCIYPDGDIEEVY